MSERKNQKPRWQKTFIKKTFWFQKKIQKTRAAYCVALFCGYVMHHWDEKQLWKTEQSICWSLCCICFSHKLRVRDVRTEHQDSWPWSGRSSGSSYSFWLCKRDEAKKSSEIRKSEPSPPPKTRAGSNPPWYFFPSKGREIFFSPMKALLSEEKNKCTGVVAWTMGVDQDQGWFENEKPKLGGSTSVWEKKKTSSYRRRGRFVLETHLPMQNLKLSAHTLSLWWMSQLVFWAQPIKHPLVSSWPPKGLSGVIYKC